MAQEKRLTDDVVRCPACNISAVAVLEHRYSTVTSHEDQGIEWDAGDVYELIVCQSCKATRVRKGYYFSETPEEFEWEIVYPMAPKSVDGLPDKVEKSYRAAMKVRDIDTNAFAVLIGRVLEFVCEDRQSHGQTLADQLNELGAKGEIPPRLAEMAQQLRHFRNVGAHASLGELTDSEVPFLEQLCRAVLEYVYTAPVIVEKVQRRLDQLRAKKST
jgi:hypothetical protein